MKNYILILIALISLFSVTGCFKDETPGEIYFSTIGVINIANDSMFLSSDDDEKIFIKNKNDLKDIKNNDRLIIEFTLIKDSIPRIDYIANVTRFEAVLVKQIFELTDQNADSIGNDELAVNSLWVKKDFLNFSFYYYYNSIGHRINLIRPQGAVPTDTVELEIRHNDMDDNKTYSGGGFVSFNLSSIKNDLKDSVIIHVKAKEYNSHSFSKYFTYKY
jgi:hypothetical protein